MNNQMKSQIVTHVAYDSKTGTIVHIHQAYDIEKEGYIEEDQKEIRELVVSDDFTLQGVTDASPENLGFIVTTELPEGGVRKDTEYLVDVKTKMLVEKPRIQLNADKTELEGNGEDSTVIKIIVVNEKGDTDSKFNGNIKVSTNRGKLSTRGGIVEMKKGEGQITITAANETIERVSVTARCMDGRCVMGVLDLEFL